jgi:hypothetical protein
LARWEKIATEDRIWDALKARVRTLDDPRLTTGFVRRFRSTLPAALDKINAEAALRFAEQGRADWARIHVDFMRQSHAGLDNVEKTAEQTLLPTRNRVTQHVQAAREEVKGAPVRGAVVAQRLIDQCKPLQSLYTLFHGEGSHYQTELFDDVAVALNTCISSYTNETQDFIEGGRLFRDSLQFATSASSKEYLEGNVVISDRNVRRTRLAPIFALLNDVPNNMHSGHAQLLKMNTTAMPLLVEVIEREGPESESAKELYAAYCRAYRGISLAAYERDRDYITAATALQIASRLAVRAEEKRDVALALKLTEEGKHEMKCYLCGKNFCQLDAVAVVSMYVDTDFRDGKYHYDTTTVRVPRCFACYVESDRQQHVVLASWFTFISIGVAIASVVAGKWSGYQGGIAGLLVGYPITLISEKIMTANAAWNPVDQFPAIRELLFKGWKFGKGPKN